METALNYYLSVLLADDDEDDRMLFKDAVAEINFKVDLQIVNDGVELMEYLLTSAIILPEILFLDLNMPFKNGFHCLEEIRKSPMLRDIFIIIYSTSASPAEIDEVFSKGANLFIHKTNSFTELKNILSRIFELDLNVNSFPRQKDKFVFNQSLS